MRDLTQIIVDQVQEVHIAQVVHEGNGYLSDFVVTQVNHFQVLETPPTKLFNISYLIHMQVKL